MVGVYFEPHYSVARTFVVKVMVLVSAVDDIYDAYGTYDEHLMFRNAIHRYFPSMHPPKSNYLRIWLNYYKHNHLESLIDWHKCRWDISCIDQLPNYMKVLYTEILKVYKEMEDLLKEQGKSYRVELAREAVCYSSNLHILYNSFTYWLIFLFFFWFSRWKN